MDANTAAIATNSNEIAGLHNEIDNMGGNLASNHYHDIPAHSHTIPSHSHGAADHTHDIAPHNHLSGAGSNQQVSLTTESEVNSNQATINIVNNLIQSAGSSTVTQSTQQTSAPAGDTAIGHDHDHASSDHQHWYTDTTYPGVNNNITTTPV